jgi:hypothetical protein
LPPFLFSKTEEDQDEGLNRIFEVNNYGSTKAVKNMGSTVLYVALYALLQLFYLILIGLTKLFGEGRVSRFRRWLSLKLYWNISIRLYIQQYSSILLASAINLYDVRIFFNLCS